MRILSVSMTGFGPFTLTQHVDFVSFADAGVFLIAGKTGAGKSTILDAICFGLYGSVPRYEGVSGDTVRLRSDYCDPGDLTRVEVVFETSGEVYRIERSPDYRRPKARGTGFTIEKATAVLSRRVNDEWIGVAAKVRDVAADVGRLVGLTEKQFLQVILLAQNRFQEFLVADSADRQSLLRTLFDTERFSDYATLLQAKHRELAESRRSASAQVAGLLSTLATTVGTELPEPLSEPGVWAREQLAAGESTLQQAVLQADAAEKALIQAQAQFDECKAVAERQRRREDALGKRQALSERCELVELLRPRLLAASLAAELQPFLAESAATAATHIQALKDIRVARAAGDITQEPEEVSVELESVTEEVGQLHAAVADEQQLAVLHSSAQQAHAALKNHDARIEKVETLRADGNRQLAQLSQKEADASPLAASVHVWQKSFDEAQRGLTAARKAHETQALVRTLDDAVSNASQLRTTASEHADELRRAQRHGRAALLAQDLTEGEPCLVCGSVKHPHPAEWVGEPVTDEDIESADEVAKTAADEVEAARSRVATATAQLAGFLAVSGDRELTGWEQDLATAQESLRIAHEAAQALEHVTHSKVELADQLEKWSGEAAQLATDRELSVRAAAQTHQAVTEAEQRVNRARGDYPSVAEKVVALQQRQERLRQFLTAVSVQENAVTRKDSARQALDREMSARGFADRAAVEQAQESDEVRAGWSVTIRQFDDELVATNAILLLPELADLPVEPAQVTAAEVVMREATDQNRVAVAARASAQTFADTARRLEAAIRTELEKSAESDEQFAVVERLFATVKGDPPNERGVPLESFVLAAELEEIVTAANGRLSAMSQGRYVIEHSDERTRGGKRTGLELMVFDAHTGASRSPRSLSGGEKFLASLALALGLAEVVTNRAGGIRLDTLFIDEGFGSLDSETLEVALGTLDQLRQGGRTIGLISHVEAMKEQIPAKLLVTTTTQGWSTIEQSV